MNCGTISFTTLIFDSLCFKKSVRSIGTLHLHTQDQVLLLSLYCLPNVFPHLLTQCEFQSMIIIASLQPTLYLLPFCHFSILIGRTTALVKSSSLPNLYCTCAAE